MRGNEAFTAQSVPYPVTVAAVVGEGGDHDARVDDDHRASRSARTAFVAAAAISTPTGSAAGPVEDLVEGRCVSVLDETAEEVLLQRHPCRGRPAAKRGCTSSGTSFTWMLGMPPDYPG